MTSGSVSKSEHAQPRIAPFWRYYGGKYRAAPRYSPPRYKTIIEPLAGAAGYSLLYHDRDILLIEKYGAVAELWRYLIGSAPADILSIPIVEHVDELPDSLPEGARILVGFSLNDATTSPRRQLSVGRKRLRDKGCRFEGWGEGRRERVAQQVSLIKHWRIQEGSYVSAPNVRATWFVDPPYNNKAGSYYVENQIDYAHLAGWVRQRVGQTIVCENEGAMWLPFEPFATLKAGINGKGSKEVIYVQQNYPGLC